MSSILSRRDLEFLLYEWLGVEALTARPRFAEHSRETFDAVLDLSATMAEREFATHNRSNVDTDHPSTPEPRSVRTVVVDGGHAEHRRPGTGW